LGKSLLAGDYQGDRRPFLLRLVSPEACFGVSYLTLTFFHPAEFVTQIKGHGYANNMNDKPSAVKKLKAFGQGR
jgi:hypothetical protein